MYYSLAAMEMCSFYPVYMHLETDYFLFFLFLIVCMLLYNIGLVYSFRGGSRKALKGGGAKGKKVPELLVGLTKMLTRQLENLFLVDLLLFGNCSIFSNSIKMAAHLERIKLYCFFLSKRISID